jgi:tRNA-splicing ligase RtcB
MYKFKEDNMKVPCYVWSEKGTMEQVTVDQIKNVSSLPFAFQHSVLCPDGHLGYGMPIGGVVALKNVVSPNMVGSDIGCGMCAVKTSLTEIDTDTLKKIMGEIRKVIPVGFKKHNYDVGSDLWKKSEKIVGDLVSDNNWVKDSNNNSCGVINREISNAILSLGTLGGGNHFIEIQKGDDGYIWIMIHSGSRNLGKQVCDHYKKLAYDLNHKWYSHIPEDNLNDYLGFFPVDSEEGRAYIKEMNYCVEFALANRKLMMDRITDIFVKVFKNIFFKTASVGFSTSKDFCGKMGVEFDEMINIAHNYASQENHFGKNVWVHRKGATQAKEGQIGIIPGSQGTSSYIVEGLGNKESFESCSHGAGRVLGRKQAIRELNLEDEIKKLDDKGIIHAIRNKDDLEEATSCYKDIEDVMGSQKDLVKVLVKLKPLAVVKG